jgi:NAD(P) transhydrogenase subunit alpha
VTIVGLTNLAAQVPLHASQVYAANLSKLFALIVNKEGQLNLDLSDEIVAGVAVCNEGQVVHPVIKKSLGIESVVAN